MTSKKLNDIVINCFHKLEDCKLHCRVTIIENMNQVDVNKNVSCIKACLECIEVCDLTQYILASKSPNTKQCIVFMNKVLKSCIKECKKTMYNKHLETINTDCIKSCELFMKSLKDIQNLWK